MALLTPPITAFFHTSFTPKEPLPLVAKRRICSFFLFTYLLEMLYLSIVQRACHFLGSPESCQLE